MFYIYHSILSINSDFGYLQIIPILVVVQQILLDAQTGSADGLCTGQNYKRNQSILVIRDTEV